MSLIVRFDGRGEWLRPDDADQAAEWLEVRATMHRERGHYACTFRGEPVYDCNRTEARCCLQDTMKVKRGWRVRRI